MIRVVTPPAAVPEALVLSSVMALLKAPTAKQGRVQELIQDATDLAELIAARKLWYRSYEETVEGGGERLYLSARPLAQVTALRRDADSEPIDPSTFTLWPENGALTRNAGGRWTPGSWIASYDGGYWLPSMGEGKPDAAAALLVSGRRIRKAVEDIVTASYSIDKLDLGVRSESMGGRTSISTTYNTDLYIPDGALAILKRLAPIVP